MPLVDREGNLIPHSRHQRPDRRVRGADVDEGGRRGGRPTSEDGMDLAEGEQLPAYEGDKGPPGYHSLALDQMNEVLSRGERAASRQSRRSGEVHPLSEVRSSATPDFASSASPSPPPPAHLSAGTN